MGNPTFTGVLIIAGFALGLSACKIQVEVPQGGTVVTASGTYRCEAGTTCTIEVDDLLFDETFDVVADEGFGFAGWQVRDRGLCGGTREPCKLSTGLFEGNVALLSKLASDEMFYLEPVVAAINTASVLCAYSDTTTNSQPSLNYTSRSEWSCSGSQRELSANGIPDHFVGTFPNPDNPNTIAEQDVTANFTLAPVLTDSSTELGGPRGATGYVLNGVKIDADTAGSCDDSGTACSLIGNSGNWSIEALGQTVFDFGTDDNNAHVQPGGAYHYHGMPEGFLAKRGGSSDTMSLIGWAADGFPIYARYGYSDSDDAGSSLKLMQGSYQLVDEINGSRPSTDDYPLGTFRQDWQYLAGSGDLDECNGRFGVTPEFPLGIYHYYATDSYPYLQRCVKGAVETVGGLMGLPPR